MLFATLVCWFGFGLVVFLVSPEEAGLTGFSLFYLSLFLALAGIFSIIGFIFRYLLKRHEFAYEQAKTALRQGLMFALLVVAALFLQGQKLLVWWNLILLIGLLAGIEYFFISNSSKANGAFDE